MASDGKIGVFRRDGRRVHYSRLSPKSTGFERGIYAFLGVKEADINLVEERLMGPFDNNAAVVVDKLLQSGTTGLSTEDVQWLFLFAGSLEMRNPTKLASMTDMAYSAMTDGLEAGSDLDGEILDFINAHPELSNNLVLENLGPVICNWAKIMQTELKYYGVVDFTGQRNHLLLSDSPCIRTTGVRDPDVVFALPLSPRKAVLGFKTRDTEQKLLGDTPRGKLLSRINESSFAQTTNRIYALNETPKKFLETRLRAEVRC